MDKRSWLRAALAGGLALNLPGCASLTGGTDPPRVSVAGVEPLQGQGLELRLSIKLRVQNPNDLPIEYNGVAIELDVRGSNFASGVSAERGSVPRFGETIVVVPITVSAMSMVRQAMSLAQGDNSKVAYVLRGKLAGTMFGAIRFESRGEFELPHAVGATPRQSPRELPQSP